MYKDMIDTIGYVKQADPELGEAMDRELGRQRQNIELIASENIVSPAVMAAMGSVLTNKYAEGYPGHRYYGGCQFVDEVEQIAIDRACKLFGAKYANVQPHSGAQANLAVYFALLNLGDTVMGMDLSQGGHLTHGSPVNMSGKNYNFVSYGVSTEDGRIDYAALAKQVAKVRPKLIVAGASAYPRAIDFEKLAEIADEAGAFDVLVIDQPSEREAVWQVRDALLTVIEHEAELLDEMDVVVPVNRIAEFLGYVYGVGAERGIRIRSFGHAGDGNLHVYCAGNGIDEDEFRAKAAEIMKLAYEKCDELGGLVSGEHGIGHAKKEYLRESVGETAYGLMAGIKQVFDPKGILNPGKVCS